MLVAGFRIKKKAASRKETAFFAGFDFITFTSKFVIRYSSFVIHHSSLFTNP